MEKTLWKFATCIVMVLLSFGFSSCGDDDEYSDGDIAGTWKCIANEGYEKDGTQNYEFKNEDIGFTITLNSDHTIKDGGDIAEWKLKGDKLIITGSDGDEDVITLKILELSEKKMITEEHEKEADYEYYEKTTYEKIK